MSELIAEQFFKCDVCEKEFPRDKVIKIGYGNENYITCRECFKELMR